MTTFPEQHTITICSRWRQHVPLECWYSPTRPHAVNTQKIKLEIFATVKTSFFTKKKKERKKEKKKKKKKTYEKTSSLCLSVCDAIPATEKSRIFLRFGTTFATKSCPARMSWKFVETVGTLLTDSLSCLPYFSTDFSQIGYRIPVVRNATEQLRVS